MTGWRVGYGAGALSLIKAMNLIQGQTSSHTSSISQHAAIEALSGRRDHIKEFVRAFLERRDLVVAKLTCRLPGGAFYVFPSCKGVIGKRTPDGKVMKPTVISPCICSRLPPWLSCPAAASWPRAISGSPMLPRSRTSTAPVTESSPRARASPEG